MVFSSAWCSCIWSRWKAKQRGGLRWCVSCGSPLLAAGRTNPLIVRDLMPLAALYIVCTTVCICYWKFRLTNEFPIQYIMKSMNMREWYQVCVWVPTQFEWVGCCLPGILQQWAWPAGKISCSKYSDKTSLPSWRILLTRCTPVIAPNMRSWTSPLGFLGSSYFPEARKQVLLLLADTQ